MINKKHILLTIYILLFLIVIMKIIDLKDNQLFYKELLKKNTTKTILLDSPRGKIFDRNGNILVDNVPIYSVVYNKSNNTTEEEINIAYKLVELLNYDNECSDYELKKFYILTNEESMKKLITNSEFDLYEKRKLTSNDIYNLKISRITNEMLNTYNKKDKRAIKLYYLMNKDYYYTTKILENNIDENTYALINETNLKGISANITWKRTYPYGKYLRVLLGNVSNIPKEDKDYYLSNNYNINDKVGISYLEKQYEEFLKGKKTKILLNQDGTTKIIENGSPGNDLHLEIDINIQIFIEDLLENELLKSRDKPNTEYYNHSYIIVSNPSTGGILAISGKQIISKNNEYSYIDVTPGTFLSSYQMGSSIKGASMSVGYLNNLINTDNRILDSCVKLYNNPTKCSFKRLGYINDIDALKLSSNYYQYLIAIKLTGNKYYNNIKINATKEHFDIYRSIFNEYGLGVKTNLDVPKEDTGIKGTKVADDLLLNFAIGQYDTYTPVELIQYINTISTGYRTKLSLMNKINNKTENILKNEYQILNNLSLNDFYLKRIRTGFEKVFTSNGTGKGYTNSKYKVAGKTGTSESLYYNPSTKQNINTISRIVALYAPVSNPLYSAVIISPNITHNNNQNNSSVLTNLYLTRQLTKHLYQYYSY